MRIDNIFNDDELFIDALLEDIGEDEIAQAQSVLSEDFTDDVLQALPNRKQVPPVYSRWKLLAAYVACMCVVLAGVIAYNPQESTAVSFVSEEGMKIIFEVEDNSLTAFNRLIETNATKIFRSIGGR